MLKSIPVPPWQENALILTSYLPKMHASFLLIWPWVAPALLVGYLIARRTMGTGMTIPAS
jgi:hypothetical protein